MRVGGKKEIRFNEESNWQSKWSLKKEENLCLFPRSLRKKRMQKKPHKSEDDEARERREREQEIVSRVGKIDRVGLVFNPNWFVVQKPPLSTFAFGVGSLSLFAVADTFFGRNVDVRQLSDRQGRHLAQASRTGWRHQIDVQGRSRFVRSPRNGVGQISSTAVAGRRMVVVSGSCCVTLERWGQAGIVQYLICLGKSRRKWLV